VINDGIFFVLSEKLFTGKSLKSNGRKKLIKRMENYLSEIFPFKASGYAMKLFIFHFDDLHFLDHTAANEMYL